MADTPMIKILLTREQQLQLAAASGFFVGILQIRPDEVDAEGIPTASIPGLEALAERLARRQAPTEQPDAAES